MILSKQNLEQINVADLIKPQPHILDLPEKVLQFGTGVLLRGLPDFFVDKANRQGVFNGRIAVVKSTSGATQEFDEQDSLYTLCVRGIENGKEVSENIIASAISRVISAEDDWKAVLEIAASEDLTVVFSNTTEVGITLVEETIDAYPPKSFPAKLLAVLHHRFQTFNGDKTKGLVIIPTELIPNNGAELGKIVMQLAHFNNLGSAFLAWLTTSNTFCNSLVDRIVPGKPDAKTLTELEAQFGFADKLLITAEPYRLWAIEGGKKVADVLTFAQADEGVIIAEDIEIYRELKVRLLNGTHTLTSGIACLAEIATVKQAMDDETVRNFVEQLMSKEISVAIPYDVTERQTKDFAATVKDRFANPNIEHFWANIAFQYTMKMKIRVLPLLLNYYKKFNKVPKHIALGFAAYLTYNKVVKSENGKFYGEIDGRTYVYTDDSSAYLYEQYQKDTSRFVENVLGDEDFWGANLTALTDFIPAVKQYYNDIADSGITQVVNSLYKTKTIAD